MSVPPVVLITRTVGENNKETVNKFSFSMMDIDAPYVLEDEENQSEGTYQLGSNNVGFDADGNKVLSITLSFKDNLSGVNTELTKRPVLVRSKFNKRFEPKSCSTSADLTTCTYTELFSDFLAAGVSNYLFTITNLSDVAGNAAPDYALELLLPPEGV